jgi:DNA repair protein RecN (Recombination protein N)
MLKNLIIRNYAIIEELNIDFAPGFNIITGETGAGKSILMGALNLVLGSRADSSVLHDKEKKCVAEACFDTANHSAITTLLQSFELDNDAELVIRREIAAAGKSRAFVNDTPVTLSQLRQLAALLVDLHQQFDTLELGEMAFQREVLDALAENEALLESYDGLYKSFHNNQTELKQLKEQQQQAAATLDYNRFLYDELEAAAFTENEIENAEAELKLLNNTEEIKQQLNAVCLALAENEEPLVQQLKMVSSKLRQLSVLHPGTAQLAERLHSATIEISDIADEAAQLNDSIQFNEEKLQLLNERMATGYRLLKKHNVQSTAALLALKTELETKLQQVLHIDAIILEKEKHVAQLLAQCNKAAAVISERRKKAAPHFSASVNSLLAKVGMPNARLKVQVQQVALSETGFDAIEFLFDANLPSGEQGGSHRFEPLYKVASGGELSRLMLCIKSLVAQKLQLPTLIFDEIDTGISGEAAKQVGILMKELAVQHQVISITHQPQIAAKAHAHYFVFKQSKGTRITTAIRQLNDEERVVAIAQMLGGEKPSATTIQNAREMVYN